MKKAILIICLLPLLVNCQTKEAVFTLHPALGLNGSQIHGDSYSGFHKAGLFAGTAIRARLDKKSAFELGFYFSQKGSRHNPDPENGDYSFYFVNLNYIDLPLSYTRFLNKDYFITGGISAAYLINYYEETERGDWTGMYPFEKFETGVNIGLGKKIKEKFSVEIRSSNSIIPVRSYGVIANLVYYPNAVARMFNRGLYNNVLTLFVSFKLDFKKQHAESQQ